MDSIDFYSSISTVLGGMKGFWNLALAGYVQWMMINLGDLIFWICGCFRKGEEAFHHSRHGGAFRLPMEQLDEAICPAGTSASMASSYMPVDGSCTSRPGSADNFSFY